MIDVKIYGVTSATGLTVFPYEQMIDLWTTDENGELMDKNDPLQGILLKVYDNSQDV